MADRYLQGRVAMVTGGASGMGRAMALALAEKGADVIIGSLSDQNASPTVDGEVVHRPVALHAKHITAEADISAIPWSPVG